MEHERHEQANEYRHRDVGRPRNGKRSVGPKADTRGGVPRPTGVETSVLPYEDHDGQAGHGSDDADQQLNQ